MVAPSTSTSSPAAASPTSTPPLPSLAQPPASPPAPDATTACVQFARAAGTVDTTTGTLGQSRQAAARAYGTPQLQALYAGGGEGRNPEQEIWQQHHARVTATATPVAEADSDEPNAPGAEQPRLGISTAVTVTGTARGDGWTAATAPYRLDCLSVADPVAGWLVDDITVQVLPPAAPDPAAG